MKRARDVLMAAPPPAPPGALVRYPCTCVTGTVHFHEAPATVAVTRGVHAPGLFLRACAAAPASCGLTARGVGDAVAGALWGALLGDALGHPLHWVYSRGALGEVKAAAFGGGLTGFAASPTTAAFPHPDSWKYFSRCTPAAEPVDLFRGHAGAWAAPGAWYHGSLRAGDSTLTGCLLAALARHVAAEGGFDAAGWLRAYVATVAGGGGCTDTWTDEAHRVWARNAAGLGAEPWEAGMEDACLSSAALCIPLLLAYAGDRDGALLAVRCALQVSHKSQLAVEQAAVWGDLLAALLAPHAAAGAAAGAPRRDDDPTFVADALEAACASLGGRTTLAAALGAGLSDEDAFFGAGPDAKGVFSQR
jgi:hypothetical protein